MVSNFAKFCLFLVYCISLKFLYLFHTYTYLSFLCCSSLFSYMSASTDVIGLIHPKCNSEHSSSHQCEQFQCLFALTVSQKISTENVSPRLHTKLKRKASSYCQRCPWRRKMMPLATYIPHHDPSDTTHKMLHLPLGISDSDLVCHFWITKSRPTPRAGGFTQTPERRVVSFSYFCASSPQNQITECDIHGPKNVLRIESTFVDRNLLLLTGLRQT